MTVDLIPKQISDLSTLIDDSEILLKKDAVSLEEKTDFKKKMCYNLCRNHQCEA